MSNYRIGPLRVTICGEGALATLIKQEFASAEDVSSEVDADIVFNIGRCHELDTAPIISDWLEVCKSGFRVNHAGLRYSYEVAGSSRRVIGIEEPLSAIQRSHSLRGRVYKVLN